MQGNLLRTGQYRFFALANLTYNNMLNSINKTVKAVVYTPNTIITAEKPAAGQ